MPSRRDLDRLIAKDQELIAKLRSTLEKLELGLVELRRMREAAGTEEVLHTGKRLGTVNDMTSDHALAISKTQRGKDKKFRAAMHKAGFTQNGLAAKLDISSASLTRYRDKRPVPKVIADKVKELTGYDGAWPGGIVD